jgi:hypothetical protein
VWFFSPHLLPSLPKLMTDPVEDKILSVENIKPVLNVAFYMRRMHSKQWIMMHFSWLSIVLNAFGTYKMRRLEQALFF